MTAIDITVFDTMKVYPAPTLPEGQIVVGKPIKVEYDLANSGYGFPYLIEFVLVTQNNMGPFSQPALFLPNRPNTIEVAANKLFKAGDQVSVYGRLHYIVLDPEQPFIIVVDTPRSEAYDVVA